MYQEILQLLVPDYDGAYEIVDLSDLVLAESSLGDAPRHFITQRGIMQHGETPIGMRYDARILQLVIGKELPDRIQYWLDKFSLHEKFTLSRNFDALGNITKCIYRKIVQTSERYWRSDLVTANGSTILTSNSARFTHWGMQSGSVLEIVSGADVGHYVVDSCTNESTLVLEIALTGTATGIEYYVYPGPIVRDLHVLMEIGPKFSEDLERWEKGYREVLRLVAHDPFWYGPDQSASLDIRSGSNLIFYGDLGYTDRAVFPIWFGSDDASMQVDVIYFGTWSAKPVVVVNGPFSFVEISNQSVDATVTMQYDALAGEIVTIDLVALRAYNSLDQVLTSYLQGDLVSMGIYPHPVVLDGINDIRLYIADGVEGVSNISLQWQAVYDGI